jgi:hypothetical protein
MKKSNERKTVMKKRPLLTNEQGSVMIVALAMLMLLTLIGISATTTSMTELQIAGAKKTHTGHLFLAEGAAMQCVQIMQNDPNLLANTTYMNDRDDPYIDVNALQFTNSLSSSISTTGTTGYAAINQGVVGSLKMGQPNLHAYAAYGWHDTPGGRVIVELGYRRAF